MLFTFGIIISVIDFVYFQFFNLNVPVLEMFGVWHPHLIIIRNLYSPNYSPSFKCVIVLDVSAKKCKLSFFSTYDVNRLLCNLFFLLIDKPGPIVRLIRNI